MSVDTAVTLIIVMALVVYLVISILFPERF